MSGVVSKARDDERGLSAPLIVATLALVIAIAAFVVALTRSSSTKQATASRAGNTGVICDATVFSGAASEARSQGHSAYESAPVAITHNGTYELIFGPLTDADAARFHGIRSNIGLSFPVVKEAFTPHPDTPRIQKYTVGNTTYVRVPVDVSNFKLACSAMRALLQY